MLNPQPSRTAPSSVAGSANKTDSSVASKKTSRGSRANIPAVNSGSGSGNNASNASGNTVPTAKHMRSSNPASVSTMTYAQAISAGAKSAASSSSSSSPAATAASGASTGSSPTPDAQTGGGQRICKGRVANLESNVPPAWWTHIFDQVYLKTDGDVVEDPEVTRSEVDLLESYPYLANVFRRGMMSAGANVRAPRILDLCCGQGRHALELARRYPRLEIYGHDQSEFLINLARDRAASAGVSDRCRFTVGDCRTIPFPADSFDLVMIMGNSFGYFTSTASDLQVLRECHRVARLGAYVVLDLTDGHYMKHSFSPRTWEWIDDDTFVCRERQLSKDGKSLVSREVVTEVSKGVIRDQFYAERLYELDELEMLMEMALFTPAREKHGRSNPPLVHTRSPTVPPGIPATSPSMSRSSSGLMHDSSAQPRGSHGSTSGVGGGCQGGMTGSMNTAGGEVLTSAKDLSKRQEDLGMMEQRMLVIACKDKGRANDPAALVGFDAFSSERAAAFAVMNNEAADASGQQQRQQLQQHGRVQHHQPQHHHDAQQVHEHDDEIMSETLGGTSGSSQFASDADDEFDSAASTHGGGMSIDTARVSAGTAFRSKMFSPVLDSGVSSGGSSSPSVIAEDTAVLTSCNGVAPESHVGTLLAHGKVRLHPTSSPVPAPNVRNLIVILGDPQIPCPGKLNDTWNPEDLETRRKLVDVLEGAGVKWKKQDGTLKVVDKHSNMIESLVDVARNMAERKRGLEETKDSLPMSQLQSPLASATMATATAIGSSAVDTLVFNLCDEGYWNDALQELHVPALLEMLQLPYTGATPQSLGLCYDKALVNAQARAMGIPTPREAYYLGSLSIQTPPHQLTPRGMDSMVREVDGLAYPAFVKPMRGDNSLGITPRSLVHSPEELHTYVCELHDARLTDVVIQEYLGGQEFSVGVIGNPSTGFHFLPILQVDYSAIIERNLTPILGFESKWDPTSPYWNEIQYIRAELPARVEAALHARCAALFERFGCRDYARFDFRAALPVPGPTTETDDEFAARIKLLEVNPNPGWCWDGKLAHMSRLAGLSYQDMIMLILQAAVLRVQGSDGVGPGHD